MRRGRNLFSLFLNLFLKKWIQVLWLVNALSILLAITNEANLIILKSPQLEVGIMPQAGGRVVLLRKPGGENILFSDPTLWTPEEKTTFPATNTPWIKYFGHETWVGPQQETWFHQTIRPLNLATNLFLLGSTVQADPWLTTSRFKVLSLSASNCQLIGPASPVTGLQLNKEIRLEKNGSITLGNLAVNTRKEAVSWDLWTLTRFPGTSFAYVPVSPKRTCRVELKVNDLSTTGMLPYVVKDGVFFFDNRQEPVSPQVVLKCKAFIDPAAPWIASFNEGFCFIKKTKYIPIEQIHLQQAFVEIFQKKDIVPGPGLLEMEFHSEYKKINPGDRLSFEETWTLLPYQGANTPDAHLAFLKINGLLPI